MSARNALNRYYARQLKELERESRPRRKNGKPEHELKMRVLHWMNANGWSCDSIESKAVFSERAGRYIRGQARRGFADIVGCAPDGTAVYVELKSEGRRSTLRADQRQFLMEKIRASAFAVCVDSVQMLESAWTEFAYRRAMDPQLAKAFLFRHLPKARESKDLDLEHE